MKRITRTGLTALFALVVVGTACSSATPAGGSGGRVARHPGADAIPTTVGPSPTAATVAPNLPTVPPTVPPVTAAPVTAAAATVPGQYVVVTDDTGMLTVEVPATWTDIDTRPFVDDDGSLRPGIGASTDLARFDDFWDAPGVVYTAYHFQPDPNVLFGIYDYSEFCTDAGFTPYNDGVFVGYVRTYTGCAVAGSTDFIVVANAPGNTITVVVIIQVVTAEDNAAYQHIIETFNLDPNVGMPTETVPPETTTPLPSATAPVTTVPVATVAPPPPLPTSPLLTTPVTSSPGGKRPGDPRVG